MKNLFRVPFAMLLASIVFISCSKEENSNNDEDNNLLGSRPASLFSPSDFEHIGIAHNNILDHYFTNAILANENSKDFAHSLIYNEVSEFETTEEDISLSVETITTGLNYEYNIEESFYSGFENELSEKTKNYLDQLKGIFTDYSLNYQESLSSINNLETTINNDDEILNNERIVVFSATNTAKYSLMYWNENIDSWDSGINGGEQSRTWGWGDVKDIAAADVGCGVGAAVTTAILNAAPGVGQVAYGSAIIAGAVGGSVAAGVTKMFSDWWD